MSQSKIRLIALGQMRTCEHLCVKVQAVEQVVVVVEVVAVNDSSED